MKKIVFVLLIFFCPLMSIFDGELDSSFGVDGKLFIKFGGSDNRASSVLVQPDRKIVVTGFSESATDFFAIARLNENSTFDTSFNNNGLVTTSFGGTTDRANAIALQIDAKIIAAGTSNVGGTPLFALIRYNHNGSPDASFGTLGLVTTDFGGTSQSANAVIVEPDGTIIAAGAANLTGDNIFALARYKTDGSLDTSFGTNGLVSTDVSGDTSSIRALALQPDGKIIAAGEATVSGTIRFALARYTSTGSLDSSFGTNGLVTTNFSSANDTALGLALQPDGKIIAAGFTDVAGNFNFALARYEANGTLDASFGNNGLVITDLGGTIERADLVLLQPDGKIVAIGQSNSLPSAAFGFALVRYDTEGIIDPNFGINGIVTTSFGGSFDQAFGAAIQADGKIVTAGRSDALSINNFALARYLIPSVEISPLAANIRAKYLLAN